MIPHKKLVLAFFVIIEMASLCGISVASQLDSSLHRGTTCVFIKQREILSGESWEGKSLDVETAARNVSKYDAIWCAQLVSRYNRAAWQYVRQNRSGQIMLYYISGCTVSESAGDIQFDYDYINKQHPEWFLLNDTQDLRKADSRNYDNRIRWQPDDKKSPHYNRFFLDVANADFQKWAVEQILERVSGKRQNLAYPYDGLGMDNVEIGVKHFFWWISQWHPRWKYAGNLEGWNEDFCHYLRVVKSALNQRGFILVVNHTLDRTSGPGQDFWERLYKSADGLMTETPLRNGWGDTPYYADDRWLGMISRHEEILGRGLIDWWIDTPPEKGPKAYESFMYTYCSWLLTKKPGKSFYYATRGKPGYENPMVDWYEEYDLPIGRPLSGRYSQGRCWLRNYENARIVVNPTTQTQKVVADNHKLWLDWASRKTLTELELPAQSGRILLPTPYRAERTVDINKP